MLLYWAALVPLSTALLPRTATPLGSGMMLGGDARICCPGGETILVAATKRHKRAGIADTRSPSHVHFASEFVQRQGASALELARKEPAIFSVAGFGVLSLGCFMLGGASGILNPLRSRLGKPSPFLKRSRHSASRVEPEEATATALAESMRSALLAWQSTQQPQEAVVPPPVEALPAELQRTISAASVELRVAAYAKLLEVCGRNYMSLAYARLLRAARCILCPTSLDTNTPGRVKHELVAHASVAAVRALGSAVAAAGASDEQRTQLGGWLLFLLRYVEEREERGTHVAVDEEAVGIYFDIPLEEEKAEVRAQRASKLYADVLSSLLPPRHFGEGVDKMGWTLLLDTTSAAIRDTYYEFEPPPENAMFWLRVRVRATISDLFRRAFNAMAVASEASMAGEKGTAAVAAAGEGAGEVAAAEGEGGVGEQQPAAAAVDELAAAAMMAAKEGVGGEDLLDVALSLARVATEYLIQFYDGARKVTLFSYLGAAEEHLAGAAGGLAGAATVYRAFVRRFVSGALSGERELGSTAKLDAAILRRLLGMSSTAGEEANVATLPEALGAVLASAAAAYPNAGAAADLKLVPCLGTLEEVLEIPSGRRHDARHAALRYYARQLVGKSGAVGSGVAVCDFLSVAVKELDQALAEEASRAFTARLDAAMRDADGSVRVSELALDEEVALVEIAGAAGLSPDAARSAVVAELQTALLSLLVAAAAARKRGDIDTGIDRLEDLSLVVKKPAAQLLAAFPGSDAMRPASTRRSGGDGKGESPLSVKGRLSELDEVLASELCWEVLDSEDVEEELEAIVNTALDLMGIK